MIRRVFAILAIEIDLIQLTDKATRDESGRTEQSSLAYLSLHVKNTTNRAKGSIGAQNQSAFI